MAQAEIHWIVNYIWGIKDDVLRCCQSAKWETVISRYPHATRAGQFVFVSNMMGFNPHTGKLAISLSELGKEACPFADYMFNNTKEEAVFAQSWFIFHNISMILRSQGASMADILKVNGWMSIVMRIANQWGEPLPQAVRRLDCLRLQHCGH